MAPRTRFAITEGPRLEPSLPESLKEQLGLAQCTRLLSIAEPATLAKPILETASGSLQRGAFRPAGKLSRGRQCARSANQPEPLGHTGHLPTGASGHLLRHESVTEPLGSGDVARMVLAQGRDKGTACVSVVLRGRLPEHIGEDFAALSTVQVLKQTGAGASVSRYIDQPHFLPSLNTLPRLSDMLFQAYFSSG
jgi:hypothetical protein